LAPTVGVALLHEVDGRLQHGLRDARIRRLAVLLLVGLMAGLGEVSLGEVSGRRLLVTRRVVAPGSECVGEQPLNRIRAELGDEPIALRAGP
jgi:hypothetical protein